MTYRNVIKQVQGSRAIDGAGVQLVRVLGHTTTKDYDPFLMLDAFDSTDPSDYIKGFPMHPHRGIETVTFLSRGTMVHEDHLGTKAAIHDGEAQWLTAGSGAYHSEMPQASDRMLGIQLWLNLPASAKMTAAPFYHGILNDEIAEIPVDGGKVRLVAGNYTDAAGIEHHGIQGRYLPLDFYDIHLDPHASTVLSVPDGRSAMVFTLLGDAEVSGTPVAEKTAAKLSDHGDLLIAAGDAPIEILFISSVRLDEPISWYGPVVMNTREEILQAIDEMQNGGFIKEEAEYENA